MHPWLSQILVSQWWRFQPSRGNIQKVALIIADCWFVKKNVHPRKWNRCVSLVGTSELCASGGVVIYLTTGWNVSAITNQITEGQKEVLRIHPLVPLFHQGHSLAGSRTVPQFLLFPLTKNRLLALKKGSRLAPVQCWSRAKNHLGAGGGALHNYTKSTKWIFNKAITSCRNLSNKLRTWMWATLTHNCCWEF